MTSHKVVDSFLDTCSLYIVPHSYCHVTCTFRGAFAAAATARNFLYGYGHNTSDWLLRPELTPEHCMQLHCTDTTRT